MSDLHRALIESSTVGRRYRGECQLLAGHALEESITFLMKWLERNIAICAVGLGHVRGR